jgi:hypothetical protein
LSGSLHITGNLQASDKGKHTGEEELHVGKKVAERRVEAREERADKAGAGRATEERDRRGDVGHDASKERCNVVCRLALEPGQATDGLESSKLRRGKRKLCNHRGHRRRGLVVRRVGLVRDRLCHRVSEEECTEKG